MQTPWIDVSLQDDDPVYFSVLWDLPGRARKRAAAKRAPRPRSAK